jgi:POT family proton-dependent oligopeptide transporter
MTATIDVKTLKTGFWHMPKTFYATLFIEFWERFAFYGLQSVAVIYFIERFKMLESDSGILFASFSALVYAMLTVGGFVGDRILGLRRTYFLGIIFLILGYILLSLASSKELMYDAMGIIVIGTALFKTNATNYISRCFESNDPRLDSAFTYFYMSTNLGGLFSFLAVPILAKEFSYRIGIMACAIGMGVALISYFCFRARFRLSDNQVGKKGKNSLVRLLVVGILGLLIAYLFSYLLHDVRLSKFVLYAITVSTVVIYLLIASKLNSYEARGMYIALFLMLQGVIFFIVYIQAATSMTLFALHNVRLVFFGFKVPPGVTQGFNSFFILTLSPILANLYIFLHKNKFEVGIPLKFLAGIFIAGCNFLVLAFAAQFFADSNGQLSIVWLAISYFLYSLGELLISALGPSMIAQLLPKRFGGFAQGMWFLGCALGMQIGGEIASVAGKQQAHWQDNFTFLHSYGELFYKLGGMVIIIGLFLAILSKPTYRIVKQVLEHKF